MTAHLGAPASGQKRNGRLAGIEAHRAEYRRTVGYSLYRLQQRIADECCLYPVAFIKIRLEWKNHGHMIDPTGNLTHPALTPRPNLRADIIEHRNSERFRQLREPQIKIRKIDQYQEIGPAFFQGLLEQRIGAPDIFEISGQLDKSHGGECRDAHQRLESGFLQLLPGNSVDFQRCIPLMQRLDQSGAVRIA